MIPVILSLSRIWDLIVSVPDHSLSFYFTCPDKCNGQGTFVKGESVEQLDGTCHTYSLVLIIVMEGNLCAW